MKGETGSWPTTAVALSILYCASRERCCQQLGIISLLGVSSRSSVMGGKCGDAHNVPAHIVGHPSHGIPTLTSNDALNDCNQLEKLISV